ncbi:unnamed protein product, partial [Ectocarpus sp. 13 AM-2016]
ALALSYARRDRKPLQREIQQGNSTPTATTDSMLTRKQQWRRVKGPRSPVETHQLAGRGGGKTCQRAAGVPGAPAHPRAINSLSIDDSLRLVATGRPATSDEGDEPTAAATAAAAAAPAVP